MDLVALLKFNQTAKNVALLPSTTRQPSGTTGEVREVFAPLVSSFTRWTITVIYHTVLGIPVNLAGCVANLINIVVFVKMGFKETINISLFGLALSDFFSLITLQWLNICATPWFRYSEIPFESFEIQYLTAGWPHAGMARVTGLLTAYIALERCLCVVMPLRVKAVITPGKATGFVVFTFVLLIVSTSPVYFVNDFGPKFFPSRNKTILGIVFKGDKMWVEQLAFSLNNFFGYVAFGLVIICSAMLIRTLKVQSQWRRSAGRTQPEVGVSLSGKERKAVVMVTFISVIFIICYVPNTLMFIGIMIEPEFSLIGRYQNLVHSLFPVAFFLESINSSVNIIIYVRMNSKFRAVFYNIFNMSDTTAEDGSGPTASS